MGLGVDGVEAVDSAVGVDVGSGVEVGVGVGSSVGCTVGAVVTSIVCVGSASSSKTLELGSVAPAKQIKTMIAITFALPFKNLRMKSCTRSTGTISRAVRMSGMQAKLGTNATATAVSTKDTAKYQSTIFLNNFILKVPCFILEKQNRRMCFCQSKNIIPYVLPKVVSYGYFSTSRAILQAIYKIC